MGAIRSLARAVRARLPMGTRRLMYRAAAFFSPETMETWNQGFPSVEGALLSLQARGFAPRFAVDVGAYHGEWTLMWKRIFPDCAVRMVEAQPGKEPRLRDVVERLGPSVDYRIALLGPESGRAVTFVEMESGSSVLEERSAYERHETTRRTEALDDLLADETRAVDFLKLDVQGYELEVLRGATVRLAQAKAVILETSLVPINRGCPLLAEVVSFMDGHGFRIADFCSQIRRKDGVLWQTDLLFLRAGSELIPDPELNRENWA